MPGRTILLVAVLLVGTTGCREVLGEPAGPLMAGSVAGSPDGAPTSGCVNGWREPSPSLAGHAVRIILRRMREPGPLVVEEMRYFTGPESPPSGEAYFKVIERWYVRGHLRRDPSFRARWLVERRHFGSTVAAVAPYGTHGYRSPDWRGFQYEFADPERRAYPELPGAWAGTPYDFANGSKEPDIRVPGLPDAVVGCLEGT